MHEFRKGEGAGEGEEGGREGGRQGGRGRFGLGGSPSKGGTRGRDRGCQQREARPSVRVRTTTGLFLLPVQCHRMPLLSSVLLCRAVKYHRVQPFFLCCVFLYAIIFEAYSLPSLSFKVSVAECSKEITRYQKDVYSLAIFQVLDAHVRRRCVRKVSRLFSLY